MKKQLMMMAGITFLMVCAYAEAPKTITLPAPDMKGGKPLMQCLALRQSTRAFSGKPLSKQQISNLLWAAFGVNRPDGKRTAPTGRNSQDPLIYAATEDGLYLYDAKKNTLQLILSGDMRAACGKQAFHKIAPIVLIYVSDMSKLGGETPDGWFFAANHIGYISQNVYLYCASEGLATVVCAWLDKAKLESAMKLPTGQKVILTQPVAFPK